MYYLYSNTCVLQILSSKAGQFGWYYLYLLYILHVVNICPIYFNNLVKIPMSFTIPPLVKHFRPRSNVNLNIV